MRFGGFSPGSGATKTCHTMNVWFIYLPFSWFVWQMLVILDKNIYIYIPAPSSLGAKWFRYRVSIHHPLGFKDGTPDWKVLVYIHGSYREWLGVCRVVPSCSFGNVLTLLVLPPCYHWGHECIFMCHVSSFSAIWLVGVLLYAPVMWEVRIDDIDGVTWRSYRHVTLPWWGYNAHCPRGWEILA